MRKKQSPKVILIIGIALVVGLLLPMMTASKPTATQSVQTGESHASFVKKLAPQVQELAKSYGVRPSILLGQVILGSDYGQTYLTHKYHNLLQLEAENGRAGIALLAPSYDSKAKKQTKSYQIYHTDLESLEDYLTRLKSGEWGDTLYTTLATSDGYKTAAKALQKSGFSENPDYASKLIAVIESENLTQYD